MVRLGTTMVRLGTPDVISANNGTVDDGDNRGVVPASGAISR